MAVDYRLDVLKSAHFQQAVSILTHAFCDDEPMTRYLKFDYVSYQPFSEKVVTKAIQDQLSVVALYQNEVVACAIVEDFVNPLALSNDFDPRFHYIFSLLEDMSKHFFHDKQFKINHIAHLFMTAVSPHHRHKGLSTLINLGSNKLAFRKRFDFMFSEFTNYFNEKGTIKYINFNKELIGSVIYQAYTLDGIKPFTNLDGFANAYLWELYENAQLTYSKDGTQYQHPLTALEEPETIEEFS